MNCLKTLLVCLLTLSLYSGCTSSTAPTPVQSTSTSGAAGEEAKPRNSMMGDPPAEPP